MKEAAAAGVMEVWCSVSRARGQGLSDGLLQNVSEFLRSGVGFQNTIQTGLIKRAVLLSLWFP